MRLPLRLRPRRDGVLVAVVMGCFFLIMGTFMVPLLLEMRHSATATEMGEAVPDVFAAGVGGLILMAACFSIVLPLLNIFSAVEIDSGGIALRGVLRAQRFAWSELSPFITFSRPIRRRRYEAERLAWYVVALPASGSDGDSISAAVRHDLYGRAVLRIAIAAYASGKGEFAAYALAEWLNALRAAAKAQPGGLTETDVPIDFKAVPLKRATSQAMARGGTAAPKRSSVIER